MKKNIKNETSSHLKSRRDFFKTTGQVVAASALAGSNIPYVHATGNDSLNDTFREQSNVALIGPNNTIKVTGIETFVLKNTWFPDA
jgi:hypothetical protein